MYNFAKQKDLKEMLEDFDHFLDKFKKIRLFTTESDIHQYDCKDELGIILYYLDGELVAYMDEDLLWILESSDNKKNMDIVKAVTDYDNLNDRIYLAFESNAENFAKELNNLMYSKSDYIKEEGLSLEEQEELDWKEWRKEEARQAYACNKGLM